MQSSLKLIFRSVTLLIILCISAVMFVIGRGHTIYFDNKTVEFEGKSYEPFYKVVVMVDDEEVAKLSARDRGMTELMGQKLDMVLKITKDKGGKSNSYKVSLKVPYNTDGIIINVPAMMSGLPEEAYMSEFVAQEPVESEEEEVVTDGFELGDV